MKPLILLAASLLALSAPASDLQAQCAGSATPTILTHDTSVVGVGNAPYYFTFPKFDPSLGTLSEIRIQSVVSLNYQFHLENRDVNSRNIRHGLQRFDDIYSDVLATPISPATNSTMFGPYNLQASDGVAGSGADFISVGPTAIWDEDTLVNETVYNVADFVGSGDVEFEYVTSALTSFTGTPDYQGSITDLIRFNISYVYCSALMLQSAKINISAEKLNVSDVLIRWDATNEPVAASYELLVSEDGLNFSTAAIVPAKALNSYQYSHIYKSSKPNKQLYFRVKQVTRSGQLLLSDTKNLNWENNVVKIALLQRGSSTSISLVTPDRGGQWKINLYDMTGRLLQMNRIQGTGLVSLQQQVPTGIYIITAIDNRSGRAVTERVFIR